MKTTPENQKLLDLIEDSRKGKIVLPQFQRNFVWSREDITALLVSILQGHFIGSFLLMNIDSENVPFAFRLLQGIKLSHEPHPDVMILDGQQRLTSLNYAFSAPEIPLRWTKHPYRFFLDLRKVTSGDLENAISSYRWIDCDGMLDRRKQFESLLIPLTEIENWNQWQNEYEQWLVMKNQAAYFNSYFPLDKPSWTKLTELLRTFQVPTITIPKFNANDPDALAEVCAIFEKINSTGVRLSVYDLLTARLYKYKIDLHGLWEETVNNYHLLDVYSEGSPDEFGVYVLRTVALMRGLDVKSKTLINLKPEKFVEDWRKATEFMEKALKRMTSTDQNGFGAFDRKWMPYVTMVSPLAAMLYAIQNRKLGSLGYKLMRRWYWSSIFRERYAGAIESSIHRDYQDFLVACENPSSEPEAIMDARIGILENPAFSLRSVSRLNSLYRGVINLVAVKGAKDFSEDDSIQFHTLEDHHIFPDGYLKGLKGSDERGMPTEKINCVINRTLIADQTNRKISKKSPSQYIKEIFPSAKTFEILNTHLIDRHAYEAMQADDYEAFLNAREKTLIYEIAKQISGN